MSGVTDDGYTFKPSYMNYAKVDEGKNTFLLNSDGNSYVKTATPDFVAFRPYFTGPAKSGARATQSIVFTNIDDSEMPHEEFEDDLNGKLSVMASHLKIAVKSTLKESVDVRILNLNGLAINTFTLQPGETIETNLKYSGVYIVQTTNGRFLKKLTVK